MLCSYQCNSYQKISISLGYVYRNNVEFIRYKGLYHLSEFDIENCWSKCYASISFFIPEAIDLIRLCLQE